MNLNNIQLRPVHIWWIGVSLFLPSLLLWVFLIISSVTALKVVFEFDSHTTTYIFLPLCAAVMGLCIPLIALRRFRDASPRANRLAFTVYLMGMLTWGWFDIKNETYQVGGHEYPNGILIDGHRHYFHTYVTWWFMPYRLIHGYDFD